MGVEDGGGVVGDDELGEGDEARRRGEGGGDKRFRDDGGGAV